MNVAGQRYMLAITADKLGLPGSYREGEAPRRGTGGARQCTCSGLGRRELLRIRVSHRGLEY